MVAALLAYSAIRFRKRKSDNGGEPAQVYGSLQVELAWTLTPVLISGVLFLATARVIFQTQHPTPPPCAIEVTVTGHQFWREHRSPALKVLTGNDVHPPRDRPAHRAP